MKHNKIFTTNIGTVELGAISILENSLEVFFDINTVSEDLQELINQNIEEAKAQYLINFADVVNIKNRKWCEAGVTITGKSIRINVTDKKEIETVLFVDFEDKKDDCMWTSAAIDIDLTMYSNELKQMILKAVVNKFF